VGVKKAAQPATCSADPLGEGALGIQLDLQLPGEELALELLVLPHVGGDHLPTWWALSSTPSPRSVVPQLLEMSVRFFTPFFSSAAMRFSGFPHRPNRRT
jgi:hypothetical protein